jgi:hypothetical protein
MKEWHHMYIIIQANSYLHLRIGQVTSLWQSKILCIFDILLSQIIIYTLKNKRKLFSKFKEFKAFMKNPMKKKYHLILRNENEVKHIKNFKSF